MNMTVMDKSRNKTCTCDCGGVMVHKIGTISRVILGRQIRIHNAPFYQCLTCDEIVFDLSASISSILAAAYKAGETDIDFEEYHR